MLESFAISMTMRITLLVLIFLLVVVSVMLISNFIANRAAVRGRLDELGTPVRGTEGAACDVTEFRRAGPSSPTALSAPEFRSSIPRETNFGRG
ncbi:hypothetical protein VZ94_21480 [Methylocucumis oryzae]|uniref:Uncharacterized protein n=1 Tax=Methylocucumis oryzae TaxID=1632867 RepID=A0A0F3IDY9_9GAMM|nr:hypothetical protein VZ94_21480 [Methylocucumis oryzae]